MKKQLLFLSLFTFYTTALTQDPVAVVLMVKNEELVINQTLEPFVQEGINSFLIFDTGSTDNTIQTVTNFFNEHNITNWYIFQEPFIDFATSRNRALDLAEEYFPDITFLFMPDAEWYMRNVKGLINFCHEHLDDDANCYLVRIANQGIDFTISRLIRSKVNARFVGVVHEVIVTDVYKKLPSDIFFELGFSRTGIEKSRKRWERDQALLQKKYDEDPTDLRTIFYLAQTYECLGKLEDAYKYYKIRADQQGWIEERYESFYRLARVAAQLTKIHETYTWHMAQDYYFAAHGLMPHRAEPLVRLAEHYWPDATNPENIALCYLFAKQACELAYPSNDLLFVDPHVYHFKRYELLSKSAGHLSDFGLGELATRKALTYAEEPYLLRNLAYYIEMKQQNC